MTMQLLVALLFIVFSVNGQQILQCRSCNRATDLSDCNKLVTCDATIEECYMDELITEQLTVVYNAGCRAKDVCSRAGNFGKRNDLIACSRCCSLSNDCNKRLCGIPDSQNMLGAQKESCHLNTDCKLTSCNQHYTLKCSNHFCVCEYDACKATPCRHDYNCLTSPGSTTRRCICATSTCHQRHACDYNPCHHGTCHTILYRPYYTCTCNHGYIGPTCKVTSSDLIG